MTLFSKKLTGLIRLFRFELPFAAGVCVLVGEILALGEFPTLREGFTGFLSVFFISASALILNDYFDVETDKINAPQRPLPSGLVTGRDVIFLSIIVTLLGLLLSLWINLTAFVVAVILWIIGFLYNWRFKKSGLPGNLMVCFSVGMTFIYGGIVVNQPFVPVVWLFAALALLIDLGEEITGDAMDVEGDRHSGSQSLAVRFGRESALRISAGIFLLVIVVSLLPFLLGYLGGFYWLPIILMDAIILFAVRKLLDSSIKNRRPYMRLIYLSASAAMVLLLLVRLFV